jgi:predicted helicase
MPTSVREVFEAFRHAPSNYERGAKFEKLIVWITPLLPRPAVAQEVSLD